MACIDMYKKRLGAISIPSEVNVPADERFEKVYESLKAQESQSEQKPVRLIFGVDSKVPATDVLQNNINLYEWVLKNKIYPSFWGRNIEGEGCLTKEEISFLHSKGCKVAAICSDPLQKVTEEQGRAFADKVSDIAVKLGMPRGAAVFIETQPEEKMSHDYMRGFGNGMLISQYTPGFKANTDAKFGFDREFSSGMQTDANVFQYCPVWATAPTLREYDAMTTTHLIHPDDWAPYAPSGTTRRDISVWQYGCKCHPIDDNSGKETFFNLNLVRNSQIIINKMF